MIIYAVTQGYLDDVPVDRVREWEGRFHEYLTTNQGDFLKSLVTDYARKKAPKEVLDQMGAVINEFKKTVSF
jgi:F-type H+/Na+-transporting ATPase subunit alpha